MTEKLPWPEERPENMHCGQKPAVYSARGQTVRWCKICGASQEFDGGSWTIPTVTRALQKEIEQQNILIVQLKERIALSSPLQEEERRLKYAKAISEANESWNKLDRELGATRKELLEARNNAGPTRRDLYVLAYLIGKLVQDDYCTNENIISRADALLADADKKEGNNET